jgi:hypothetical protein
VTLNDLQKLIQSQQQLAAGSGSGSAELSKLLRLLRDREFWLWDSTKHKERDIIQKGNCCFNHIIGLPRKNGVKKPIFDYEAMLYKALLQPGYLNSDPSLLSSNPNNVKLVSKKSTCGSRKPQAWE